MNARQNRSVPPLNYPRVYELCCLFPECEFWINGGIRTLQDARLVAYGYGTSDGDGDGDLDVNDCTPPHASCHGVPCSLCKAPNGSCVAPPMPAPINLRGCMMGRAAIDDPCMFHDVDRYFYGEASNPCQNRMQVLEKYCQYLERRHPRRCCSENVNHCNMCADVYGAPEYKKGRTPSFERATGASCLESDPKANALMQERSDIPAPVIGRCLKPVQGLFHGIPGSRSFKRECDKLSCNTATHNCGPGYILRKAIQSVPLDVLHQNFDKHHTA